MRLSALDGSFLRLESPQAHMHVGWSAVLAQPSAGRRPTVEQLRERMSSRIDRVPWCRWRLERAPLGLTEPRWVEDPRFDMAAHVLDPCGPQELVGPGAFAALRDAVLSQPLDLTRPPWQIVLVPHLADGRIGMIGKIHHALVDGMAALQIVQLLADEAPGAADHQPGAAPAGPARRPAVGWARDSIGRAARDGVAVARAAARPVATARGAVRDVRRVLNAARDDVLPRAPDSPVNVPIGSRRTLVGYHADRSVVRAARAGGGSINDVGLAVVAGALRALALRQGDPPASPLKVMVPVNMRGGDEYGLPGNRISMVNLELPVDLAVAVERLQRIRTQTQHLKHGDRAEATESLYAAGALLPGPLRSAVAKAMASPRAFNLTISQSPAPRELSVLACALEEVYSVVPITQGHALSIGMIRFKQELFFGCYADPDAFPAVVELPSLLDAEMRALGARARRDGPQLIGSINGAPQRQALG